MTTFNQSYPLHASASVDNYVPDTALLRGQTQTQTFDLPANSQFAQYEVVKIAGKDIAKLTATVTAGDMIGIVCYPLNNLTATSASLRDGSGAVVIGGIDVEYDESKLVFPLGTADVWRAVAAAQGIKFSKPLAFS